jgi:hypothetical protein
MAVAPVDAMNSPVIAPDFELLLDAGDYALLEDMEFYAWLARVEGEEAVAQTILPGHDQPFRLPVREEAAYVGSYSLELSLSGNPGAEPQTLRLPTGSIRHPTAAGGTCAQGVPGTAENLN